MNDTTSLLVGLLFGSIGVGYFIYGKKQNHTVALVAGLFLIGLPYAIDNNVVLVLVSLLLMAIPRFLKL